MNRIAVISDIHGNVPALQAVLNDIQKRAIERIICLGDLVGKGPDSDQVIDIVRNRCESVVKGNWDDLMNKKMEINNPAYPAFHETQAWHKQRIGPERLAYLASLPFSCEFPLSGRLVRLFHASSTSVYHRVYPTHPFEERLAMFENTEETGTPSDKRTPEIVGYGDIHTSFLQQLQEKTLFNTGSVGNPLDTTQASYAVLEGEWGSWLPAAVSVQLIRVPYDIELAVRLAEQSGMPELDAYKQELRTARYRGLSGN